MPIVKLIRAHDPAERQIFNWEWHFIVAGAATAE